MDDEENSRFMGGAYENLSELTSRELAYRFKIANENQRTIYRDFLKTQPQEYQEEFKKHLDDPLLEENEDDFGDE